MKNDSVEMITDDGDNLVDFDMGSFLNPTSATNRFIQEQAMAKFMEMTPSAMKVFGEMKKDARPFDFGALLN